MSAYQSESKVGNEPIVDPKSAPTKLEQPSPPIIIFKFNYLNAFMAEIMAKIEYSRIP